MSSYCWDTSVFLALLKGGDDNRSPSELPGLRAAIDDVNSERATLVTSTLIFAEVLPASMPEKQYDIFRRFFQRDNVLVYEVSAAIAHIAGDVRARGLDSGRKTSTEDAVFIATALSVGCDCLHSFDPHHLRLAETFEDELIICKPVGIQGSLDIEDRPEA